MGPSRCIAFFSFRAASHITGCSSSALGLTLHHAGRLRLLRPVQVAVLYASDYGYSDRLSQTIARGITKANVAVEMLDLLSADPQV